MAKSPIYELPKIVDEGRREAQRILERLGSGTHIGLQTNELVLPPEYLFKMHSDKSNLERPISISGCVSIQG